MSSQTSHEIELSEIGRSGVGEPLDASTDGIGTLGNNDVMTRRGVSESTDPAVQRTYTGDTGDYITAEGTVRSDDCEDQ